MADTRSDPPDGEDPAAGGVRAALVDDLDSGFAALMRAYSGAVHSLALRTGGPGDAEDVAAETFLRAYRALCGYDEARLHALRPRPWLLSIAVNTRRNLVRDAGRRPRSSDVEAPDRAAPGPSVEDRAQNTALSAELALLLAALPETQRVAVVLRHVVDLPVDEVASVLGCPTGTARSHVSRGLRRLRELVTDAGTSAAPTSDTPTGSPS